MKASMRPAHRGTVERAVWLAAAVALATACKGLTRNETETHFLDTCGEGCPAGLDCVCGACTRPCEDAASCSDLAAGAQCLTAAGGCRTRVSRVCDVECSTDADCAALGDSLACAEGRCRQGATAAGVRDAGRRGVDSPAEATTPSMRGDGGARMPPVSEWPMLGHDAQSTYFNEAETAISVQSAPTLRVAWTADLGGNITGAPIQAGERLYVGNNNGLFCFDAATGAVIWDWRDVALASTPAYSDGRVFVHTIEGHVVAVDALDGSPVWEITTSDESGVTGFSSVTVSGDAVYVGGSSLQEIVTSPAPTFRGFVLAADQRTGRILWTQHTVPEGATGAAVWSTVSLSPDGQRVYATTGNNYLPPATDTSDAILSLSAASGAIEWKAQRYEGDVWSFLARAGPEFDFGSNPILFDATVDGERTPLVAAGQKSGDIHVLRRSDGAVVSTRQLSPGSADGRSGVFVNGAWDGERLLFAANGATSDAPGSEAADIASEAAVLFGVTPEGDIAWERQLPGLVFGRITVANGVGFVGAGRHLEAFDTRSGELLFKHTVDATLASTPTLADGRVAFGSGLSWGSGIGGSVLTVLELP